MLRFDLPEDRRLCHEMIIPIRWGDMDALGHVNNTIYFRYLESARVEWLRSARPGAASAPSADLSDPADGTGPIIVNAFCNFLKQVEYPGDLLLRQYIGRPGRTSIDIVATMERTDAPGVIVAAGGAKTVWFDFRAQKPVPLPDWLRTLGESAQPGAD